MRFLCWIISLKKQRQRATQTIQTQQQHNKKKTQNNQLIFNTMYQYETLIQDEGVDVASLPKEVKSKIQGLKLQASKKTANSDAIKRLDLYICDLIQNFVEDGLPTEKEYQNTTQAKAEQTRIDNQKRAIISYIENNRSGRWIEGTKLTELTGINPSNGVFEYQGLRLVKIYLTQKYRFA